MTSNQRGETRSHPDIIASGGYEQKLLRMIFDNAREFAIITMDLEGSVTSWNTGAERLLGYTAPEILGHDARIIFTPEDRQRGSADRELRTALERGRAENERWHLRKDGSRFWGSGVVMPLYEGDEACGLVKIMRDMTAQRQLQEQRAAQARELERRVAEASAAANQRARQLETLSRRVQQAERRERRRLARVLHDDLQQLLVAASMRVQMAQSESPVHAQLTEAHRILEQAIDTARSLSHELSPTVLTERGFGPALHWLAERMEQRHKLPVTVHADERLAADMSADLGETLFHMVRELLFNVIKHAQASRAWVKAERAHDQGLRVTVADDGVGFDPAVKAGEPEHTHGLHEIREKLSLWQGTLHIEPGEVRGCRVIMEIPRVAEAEAA